MSAKISRVPERASKRFVPQKSATATICDQQNQEVYGVIANISIVGACIVCYNEFTRGQMFSIRISFYGHSDLFEVVGRVMWSRTVQDLVFVGVEFRTISEEQRKRLMRTLETPEFWEASPIDVTGGSEFDDLLRELKKDLDDLGLYLKKSTGEED